MYITLAELKKALGQKESIFTSVMDDPELTTLITNRDSFIDEYIGGSVSLPFDPVPKIIIHISTKLCVYDVYAENANQDVPDVIKDGKSDAMKLLDKILARNIPLGSQVDAEGDNVNFRYQADDQFFTEKM